MADTNYNLQENPVYNTQIRALQDSDPARASTVFNPLLEAMLNNTHAVKLAEEEHATDADRHITAPERQGWDAGAQIALEASNQASTLEGRVGRLEDGLYNNITGNPFLLTFGDLEGVVLTKGVWNKQRQRVEC